MAWMLIGTFWMFSSRFCAVTMMSPSVVLLFCGTSAWVVWPEPVGAAATWSDAVP